MKISEKQIMQLIMIAQNSLFFVHGKMIHNLRKKIQSLIDNYCEHPYIEGNGIFECIECGKIISR